MRQRVPTDPNLIEVAYRLANLATNESYVDAMCPVMDGIFGLLDTLHDGSLGDAPLPVSFDATGGGWS